MVSPMKNIWLILLFKYQVGDLALALLNKKT
jgi:hypothetical protein